MKMPVNTMLRQAGKGGAVQALTPPIIAGDPYVGAELTTDTAATWSAVVTVTFQWFRGLTPIAGATSEAYTATISDLGANLRRVDTGNGLGGSVSQISNAIGPITSLHLGALVKRGAPDVARSTPTPWASAEYDSGPYFDTGDATRLTSLASSSVVRVQGNVAGVRDTALGSTLDLRLNGSAVYAGFPEAGSRLQITGDELINVMSPILVLATPGTDYFEHQRNSGAGGNSTFGNDERTWLSIEEIDPDLKRVLLGNSGAIAVAANTPAIVSWDTETYDVGGYHAGGATKIIIPAGHAPRVRLGFYVMGGFAIGGALGVARILKNGAVFAGMAMDSYIAPWLNAWTAPIACAEGDEFTLEYTCSGATNLLAGVCWFAAEEVRDVDVCLVYKAANQTFSQSGVLENVEFGSTASDTAGVADADGERLIVPSGRGYTKARMSFTFGPQGVQHSNWISGQMWKNDLAYWGKGAHSLQNGGSVKHCNAYGAWIDVVGGDEFVIKHHQHSGTMQLDAGGGTWACLELK